jgi:hypothetical protein
MAELRVDESSTRRYSHEVCDFRVPKGKCGTSAQSCRSPEINTSHTVAAVRHPPHPPLWLVTLSSLPQPFNTVQLPPQHLTLHRYPPVQPWGTSARNPPTKPTLSSVQAESSAPRGTHHPLPLFPQRYSQTPPADHWEEALAAAAVTPIPGAQPPKPQRCVPTINITEADTVPPSSSPLLLPAKRILPQTVLPAEYPNPVLRPMCERAQERAKTTTSRATSGGKLSTNLAAQKKQTRSELLAAGSKEEQQARAADAVAEARNYN